MKYDVMILSGGFDPIHEGHIKMIRGASELADMVIVGVNSDEWLKRKKGFVFMKLEQRQYIVSSIKGVSMAVGFNDDNDTASELLMNALAGFGALSGNRSGIWDVRMAFGNGGDRKDMNTVPVEEVKICDQWDIAMEWNVGGGKIESSSELVKRAKQ